MIKCNMRSIIAKKGIMLNLVGIMLIVALTGLNASIKPQEQATFENMSASCMEKVFPIVSGGDGREEVHCQVLYESPDKSKAYIITAGNTTSDKYVPSPNPPHAYMHAVDLDGNWRWGKFFYNQSISINSITGCTMNENGRVLTTGLSDPTAKKPFIMEVDPETGSVEHFVYFQRTEADDFTEYVTTNGLYHDVSDPADGQQYYYASFVYNHQRVQLIKAARDTGEVKWNYQYDAIPDVNPFQMFLHGDVNEPSRMFWLGTMRNTAQIIKFAKYNANVLWQTAVVGKFNNEQLYEAAAGKCVIDGDGEPLQTPLPYKREEDCKNKCSGVQADGSIKPNPGCRGYAMVPKDKERPCVHYQSYDLKGSENPPNDLCYIKGEVVEREMLHTIMTEIHSFVQPPRKESLYLCGYQSMPVDIKGGFSPIGEYEAYLGSVVRMSTKNGEVEWQYSWGEELFPKVDKCKVITYDERHSEIVMMIESTNLDLRPDVILNDEVAQGITDIVIITMSLDGRFQEAYNINYNVQQTYMSIGSHSGFAYKDAWYFGGQSDGFKTKIQEMPSLDPDQLLFDSYVFKYSPRYGLSSCLYDTEIDIREVQRQAVPLFKFSNERTGRSTVEGNEDVELDYFTITRGQTPWKQGGGMFEGKKITQGYVGDFDLLNTIKLPKPCAKRSDSPNVNITIPAYYVGQVEEIVRADDLEMAASVADIPSASNIWMFENGTLAQDQIGRFDVQTDSWHIYTNQSSYIGTLRTIVRGCSANHQLTDVFFQTEIKKNTRPDFVKPFRASITLNTWEDKQEIFLPEIKDEEGQDFEVYITKQENKNFPPFLFFDKYNRKISLRPDDPKYQGKTTYFNLVLKEKGTTMPELTNTFFCTVNVDGPLIEEADRYNYTEVAFKMTEMTNHSSAMLTFSQPMNLSFIRDNFQDIFDIYVKNNTFRDHQTMMPILDVEVPYISPNNTQLNFTVTFSEPFLLGLLKKIHDKIYVRFKGEELLTTKGVIREDYHNGHFRQMILKDNDPDMWTIYRKKCERDENIQVGKRNLQIDSGGDAFNDVDSLREEQLKPKDQEEIIYGTANRMELYQSKKIPIQFDYRDPTIAFFRQFAENTYWYLIGFLIFQFFALTFRGMTLLPLWTLIDYMQLASFLPLFNFTFIPYMYDALKPFLVSHLVLTNKAYVFTEFKDWYFNENWKKYWLSVAKLGQSLVFIVGFGAILILTNIIFFLLYYVCTPKGSKVNKWVGKKLSEFKFNAYIRFYMLSYYDLTFFAVMKLTKQDEVETQARKMANVVSIFILVASVIIPTIFGILICKRFPFFAIKEAKQNFNALVLKLDKAKRMRIITPHFFFIRRFITAVMLTVDLDSKLIFLQYVAIVVISHAWMIYVMTIKPYNNPLLNRFVFTSEGTYVLCCVSTLVFSDSEPSLTIKMGFSYVLFVTVVMLIFNNFLCVMVLLYKGPDKLKEETKIFKQRRIDMEIAWDFERDRIQQELNAQDKLRRDRLVGEDPIDIIGMSAADPMVREMFDKQNDDNVDSLGRSNTITSMSSKVPMLDKKKKKKRGKKGKNQDDEVQEIMFGGTQADFSEDPGFEGEGSPRKGNKIKKKKTKKRDKLKNQQDDVVDHIEMIKSKSSFKSKVGDDFNTIGPPQDDFYIEENKPYEKQGTSKSKKSHRSIKSKMASSKLSDLIQAPVNAPGDDEFIIEAPVPESNDELAGKKTKSSSDKQNLPESSSSEKKKAKKKKKRKGKKEGETNDGNENDDQKEDEL